MTLKRKAASLFRAKPALTAGILLGVCTLGSSLAQAESPMRSASYEIQLGNFNMTSGEKSSSGYKVTDTVGQTAAGEFGSNGYTLYAGFQYLYAIPEFSFRISDLSIELGELTSSSFSTATNTLTISTRSGGYSILARAEHPLELSGRSTTIPFTSCDSGCSISSAASWTDTSNKGFGFNVDGTNKAPDFTTTDYFRPFADASANEAAQSIASSTQVVKDDVLTVTYKAVVAGNQAGGNYETGVRYTAVPTY